LDNEPTLIPHNPNPPAVTLNLQAVFVGKDGLRAGWGLLIFIGFFAVLFLYIGVIGHGFHPPHRKFANPGGGIGIPPYFFFADALPFLATVFITGIMSRIEHRPNSVYGLGGSRKLTHFLSELAWGIICLSLLVLTLWGTGFLVIDSRVLFGRDIFR
jgi:hypothetical protein